MPALDDYGLGTYEHGGETWPVLPWVIRTREVKLLHVEADTIDGYKCRWPNALPESEGVMEFRYSPLYGLTRDKNTGIIDKAEGDIHVGHIQMLLVPGQDPAGEVRCLAIRQEPRETRTAAGHKAWLAENPDGVVIREESLWSNPRPVGVVEPDPVPEPGIVVGLFLGVLALAAFSKVFRRKH